MKSLCLLLITLFSFLAVAADSDVKAQFYVNGKRQHHAMVKPGAMTSVEIEFINPKTNEVFKDFKIMHGKIMHMVILKSDLSTFKHIHPYFDPVTGRFFVMMNLPMQDPDNHDTTGIFKTPGMYMIMADVVIKGLGMRMAHYHLMVMGPEQEEKLVLDKTTSLKKIVKYFPKEGNPKYYRATLEYEQKAGCGGSLVDFHLNLKKKTETGYADIDTILPWLGMGGHALIVSEGFMKGPMGTFDMAMGHIHSPGIGLDERPLTSDFVFSLFDNGRLFPGKTKAWFQVNDNGKVLKLPFTFDYKPASMRDC